MITSHALTKKHCHAHTHTPTIHAIVDAPMMRRHLISSRPSLSLSHRAPKLHMVRAHTELVPMSFGAAPLDHAALFMVLSAP